jgi:cytochrome o ubiquinol oxidase subunit IV
MEWGIYFRIIMHYQLSSRVVGFVSSLILTLAAYFIILHPEIFNFDIKTSVIIIFILALTQSLVQLVFFISIWKEGGPLWNLGIFASTVSIIFIIVFFSVWIMNHLNYNMR